MTFLKPLTTSTAALALMTSMAAAESHAGNATMTNDSSNAAVVVFDYDTEFTDVSGVTVAEITGTPVVMSDGERIGEIDHVGKMNGKPVLIVGIGGFLGIGEHSVAMNLDELSYDATEDAFVVQGYSKDQLKELPEYNEDQITFLDADQTLSTAWGTSLAAGGAATMADESVKTEMAEAGNAIEQQVEEGANDVAQAADTVGQKIEEGAEDLAQSADHMMDEVEAEATDMAQSADAMMEHAETDLTAQAQDMNNESMDQNPVVAGNTESVVDNNDPMMADGARDPMFDYQTRYADIADMPVNDIVGTKVFAANGEDVGEVDNVGILDSQPVIVVGIGGFLGLGEHSVALNLDRMEYDNRRAALVVSGYSEEELKAMPEFDRESIGFLDSEAPLSELWTAGNM